MNVRKLTWLTLIITLTVCWMISYFLFYNPTPKNVDFCWVWKPNKFTILSNLHDPILKPKKFNLLSEFSFLEWILRGENCQGHFWKTEYCSYTCKLTCFGDCWIQGYVCIEKK